jgi:hypothetical protein
MKDKISFPLIIGDKVYYSFEEIPDEIKEILNEVINLDQGENYNKTKLTINDIEYSNFEDVPVEYQKFIEDKNKDGVPDLFENKIKSIKKESTSFEFKKTPIKNTINEDFTSSHKKRYGKKVSQNKDSNILLIGFLILAISGLIAYIILRIR